MTKLKETLGSLLLILALITAVGHSSDFAHAQSTQGNPSTSAKTDVSPGELRGDIEHAKRGDELERVIEDIEKRVLQAKRDALEIRTVRARLKDFLDAKECAGAGPYMRRLDQRAGATNILLSDLQKQCERAGNPGTSNLMAVCREERQKLTDEADDIKASKRRFGELCPGPAS